LIQERKYRSAVGTSARGPTTEDCRGAAGEPQAEELPSDVSFRRLLQELNLDVGMVNGQP